MNAKEIRIIIGIIGNVVSFFITLSHIPEVMEMYKKKSVDNFKQDRHVVMLVNCSLWVFYGLPIVQNDSILVATNNGVRFVVEAIYMIVFIVYSDKTSDSYQITGTCLVLEFAVVSVFDTLTMGCTDTLSTRRTFLGVICTIFTILMHASLSWDAMVDALLDAQTYKFMPLWFSFVSFINAGIWIAYSSIYTIDIYILIVNILGALGCASQLIIGCLSYDSPCPLLRNTIPPWVDVFAV